MNIGQNIIPSHMGIGETPKHFDGGVFDNVKLRLGEVQEIVYPDDDRSRTKRLIEYNVLVQHRENGTAVTKLYEHCIISNLFGGFADEFHFTLRAEAQPNTTKKKLVGLGSKVILLCLNGETLTPIIIGGVRDGTDDDKKAKDKKHHLHWVFNGITFDVNDDGEMSIAYMGKSKIDGKLDDNVDKDTTGSLIKFTKEGNISIATGDGKEGVIVDKKNQQVAIKHEKGVLIGQATDKMLLGETHRKAQKQMNQKLIQLADGAGKAVLAAATALTTAGSSMSTPITGAVAAAPQITAAATALQTAAQLLSQISQAVNAFEQGAGSSDYLSQYNKND